MQNRIYKTCLAASLIFCALQIVPALRADTVILKNGDKLTGTAIKLEGGKLSFKTAYADAIAIAFDQVESLSLDQPMLLTQPEGLLKVTGVERTSTGLLLTLPGGSATLASGSAAVMRTPADQKAYEKTLHPNWGHGWAGNANVSFALARGNSQASTFGAGATAARTTLRDQTSLYMNTIYAANGNATPSTSANASNGGIRYDRNANPEFFYFGTGDFSADALQNLDLRSILGGGIGYHAVKNARQTLDILGGLVWTHETYSAIVAGGLNIVNSFAALDLGEQYALNVGKESVFNEQFYLYPDMNDTSRYQMVTSSTFSTKLSKIFNWQVSFSDQYTSFPPAGKLDNDVILTTGLGVTLSRT